VIPGRANEVTFSLCHCVHTKSGAHWASHAMNIGVSFPRSRAGREADHPPTTSAEVKNTWSYTFTAPYFFMAW